MRLTDPFLNGSPWREDYWQYGPSEHLSWAELACHDGTSYPHEWRLSRAVLLGIEFEWVRATLGGFPIRIGSGYRTESWNKKARGSRTSQHIEGMALDTFPPRQKTLPELLDAVLLVAHRPGGRLRGIGVYRGFIHMDIRESLRVCRWKGNRARPEMWRRLQEAL